jgi:NAD(P)H-dependent FMN reductase
MIGQSAGETPAIPVKTMNTQSLFIPVILGTVRQGHASGNVARFVFGEVQKREGVETELIDIRDLSFPNNDAGEQIKNARFSAACTRADGLILVVPEYNHGYPGMLKHALDSNLKEYIHKAVGICGVSAGGFGGARAIQNLLPVLRELGLVTIFWDGNFSDAQMLFDENGKILNEATHVKRMDQFLGELIWMSKVLRYGRENVSI